MENYDRLNKISTEDLIDRWSRQKFVEDTDSHESKTQATPKSTQKCHDLIQLLQNNVSNLQNFNLYNSEQGFNIIIGQVNNDSWIGLSCLLSAREQKLITSDLKDTSQIPSEILFLIERIKTIIVDFKPVDRYVDFIRHQGMTWEVAVTRELLIEKLLKTANFLQTETIDNHQPYVYGKINKFLKTYLINLQTYTLGKNLGYSYERYTFGQTPAKDWIIFNTQVFSAP